MSFKTKLKKMLWWVEKGMGAAGWGGGGGG